MEGKIVRKRNKWLRIAENKLLEMAQQLGVCELEAKHERDGGDTGGARQGSSGGRQTRHTADWQGGGEVREVGGKGWECRRRTVRQEDREGSGVGGERVRRVNDGERLRSRYCANNHKPEVEC